LTISLKRGALVLMAMAGLALTGCAATRADASTTAGRPAQTITLVVHLTNLEFITVSGSSSPYPSGPLSTGDRVLGRDDIQQHGAIVGSDYEVCTVSFGLHVLCDDMVEITNLGQIHITWMFQWPSSGTSGPSAWKGVVDGGTGTYQNAIGDFQAHALPNRDISITTRIVRPS
jgi:hypothetical protein